MEQHNQEIGTRRDLSTHRDLTSLENYKQSKNFININNIGLPDRKSYIEEKWTTNERKKYEAEKYISGK